MLMWTIWRTPTNASKWRMGFNSAFKGLIKSITVILNRNMLFIPSLFNKALLIINLFDKPSTNKCYYKTSDDTLTE